MDLGAVSTFIIDVVSEIDPAVGSFIGESWFMRVEKGEVLLGPLKAEAIKEYREKAKLRKGIIRRLWKLLDEFGEQKVEEIFNKLQESMKNK